LHTFHHPALPKGHSTGYRLIYTDKHVLETTRAYLLGREQRCNVDAGVGHQSLGPFLGRQPHRVPRQGLRA
jgi:hypothetical protein